jgi:hypothetical protein
MSTGAENPDHRGTSVTCRRSRLAGVDVLVPEELALGGLVAGEALSDCATPEGEGMAEEQPAGSIPRPTTTASTQTAVARPGRRGFAAGGLLGGGVWSEAEGSGLIAVPLTDART